VFEAMRTQAALSRGLPLGTVLRSYGRAVIVSIVSTWMLTAAIVVVILLTPAVMPRLFGLSPATVQSANLAATAALCISVVVIGAATDRYGIRRVAVPVLLFLIASSYELYRGAATSPSALLPLYVLAGLGAGGVVLTPIAMVRAFPASIRFSGVSFSYNLAYAVFGGVTPLLVSWLAHLNRSGPAYYVMGATFAGLAAILSTPKLTGSDAKITAASL
jgi:MFS family permease